MHYPTVYPGKAIAAMKVTTGGTRPLIWVNLAIAARPHNLD
ncbi:hypothetical protein ACFQGA_04720 [Marinobacter koreensis]|uniref:Uncharacterized protein n=1 Tax=Marinobacter koreensis TaxID=335974 RepID=A0ABW0RL52_9GAMM|nr:hypothetical protein [Marinobacter koreensis]